MTTPGIITGGTAVFRGGSGAKGIFAPQPGATPKYALNRGLRDNEYRSTMARIFIDVTVDQKAAILQTLPADVQAAANVVLRTPDDTGRIGGGGYIDFILTSAQEPLMEKMQVVDTLTDNYVAFFTGQEPATYTFSGILYNTFQDDQRVQFLRLYRELLRGSRLAVRSLITRLRYDSFVLSGYLTNLTMQIAGETDTSCAFTFNFLVKDVVILTTIQQRPEGAPQDEIVNQTIQDTTSETREGLNTPPAPPTANALPAASRSGNRDPREADSNPLPTANPNNVNNDGQNGLTNTLGATQELIDQVNALAGQLDLNTPASQSVFSNLAGITP